MSRRAGLTHLIFGIVLSICLGSSRAFQFIFAPSVLRSLKSTHFCATSSSLLQPDRLWGAATLGQMGSLAVKCGYPRRTDCILAASSTVSSTEEPDSVTIEQLPLSDETRERLEQLEVVELTPIQRATFQSIADGRDVIAKSSTGTGKTLAFCLPLIENLLAENRQSKPSQPTCLILLPTRELAQQVERDFRSIAGKRLKTVLLVGGTAIEPQVKQLKDAPQVAIGTLGRIVDLVRSRHLSLLSTSFLVLDEADQMLEAGFADELDMVVDAIPRGLKVQCLLFCATLSNPLLAVGRRLCRNPDLVDVSRGEAPPEQLQMLSMPVTPTARSSVLVDLLLVHSPRRALIFTNTKMEAVELAGTLAELWHGGASNALHGDLPQFQRKRIMESFRSGSLEVLVATDVAARGLHIDGLDLVIHCGIPISSSGGARRNKSMREIINVEQFVHRTGRTGRMGARGTSVLLYDPGAGEATLLGALERQLKCAIKHAEAPRASEVEEAVAALARRRAAAVEAGAAARMLKHAEAMLEEEGAMALARAMAALGGVQVGGERSLLDNKEGRVTIHARATGGSEAEEAPGEGGVVVPSMVMDEVKERFGGKKVKLGRVWMCEDGSAVFDVSAKQAQQLLGAGDRGGALLSLARAEALPVLAKKKKKD